MGQVNVNTPGDGSTVRTSTAPAIGFIVGILVAILIIALLVYFLRAQPRRRHEQHREQPGDPGDV